MQKGYLELLAAAKSTKMSGWSDRFLIGSLFFESIFHLVIDYSF